MIQFDATIPINRDSILSPNLADRLSDADRRRVSDLVWGGYDRDEQSRTRWRERTQAAMDLAMQLQQEKNFPWPGCSNVAFPLVTIAVIQFHSQAYPALVQPDLVRCRVGGDDPTGELTATAALIGQHMSWQLLEESDSWEEQHDRLLINVPIVGCAFKKTYWNGATGQNVSELVLAQDLVLDYYARSVEDSARKTHITTAYRNEIYEGVLSGIYCDVLEEPWFNGMATPVHTPADRRGDARVGAMAPQPDYSTPFTLLEQHLGLDLDGDGYLEPYIATIEASSRQLLRLVLRVDSMDHVHKDAKGRILRITPTEYFTKYEFIPSPDGGIYGIGFGTLLGPLNESVNTLINQLIDAGTMATTAGGFLGRGAKIRGGQYTFAPMEWKRVDSTADDLAKSIFPLPVREPSNVLLQLLNLLVEYTNRISGTTAATVGEMPVANTPAATTAAMLDQGQKVYAAILKRLWRGMKDEFRKIYRLNALFLPETTHFGEAGAEIDREAYFGSAAQIVPAADPNSSSPTQRAQTAVAIKQAASTTPGYDLKEVERNFLRALRVDSIDRLYPGPDKIPPPPNPKMVIEQGKQQVAMARLQQEQQKFMAEMVEQQRVNEAKILQLEAQAAKLLADANGVDLGHEIAALNAAIGAARASDQATHERARVMMDALRTAHDLGDEGDDSDRGSVPGLGSQPGNASNAPGLAGPARGGKGTAG